MIMIKLMLTPRKHRLVTATPGGAFDSQRSLNHLAETIPFKENDEWFKE